MVTPIAIRQLVATHGARIPRSARLAGALAPAGWASVATAEPVQLLAGTDTAAAPGPAVAPTKTGAFGAVRATARL